MVESLLLFRGWGLMVKFRGQEHVCGQMRTDAARWGRLRLLAGGVPIDDGAKRNCWPETQLSNDEVRVSRVEAHSHYIFAYYNGNKAKAKINPNLQ